MKCPQPYEFRRKSGAWVSAPCGHCPACRVNRATEWATRIMHELEPVKNVKKTGYFLTLTFETDPLTICKEDLQKFFKRVRKDGIKMKYFACGEYGEKNGRPHYHVAAIVENNENVDWKKYWTFGFVSVGDLSFQSARYTANYLLKQSDMSSDRTPPFQLVSKGLGEEWMIENEEVIKRGLTRNGNQQITPRFYRKKLEIVVPRKEEEWINHWQRKLNNDALTERKIKRNKI